MEEGEGVQQWDVGCVEDFFFSEWIKLYFCGGFFCFVFFMKKFFSEETARKCDQGLKKSE